MKVIIIEDEKSIIDAVNVAFEFRWPEVNLLSARTGKYGIKLVKKEKPDIVILDINLPDISGFEVVKEVRGFSKVPVIILTVRSEDTDVLQGLEAGADDYVIKPFNYLTLLARVKAVLRRTENVSPDDKQRIDAGPRLKIDVLKQKVTLDGKSVKLTPQEYRLLVLLAKNRDHLVTYKQILKEIWDKNFKGDTQGIRIYVRHLRHKLHDIPSNMVLNQRGSGYIFRV